jgi:hypothetical protein
VVLPSAHLSSVVLPTPFCICLSSVVLPAPSVLCRR